MGAGEFALAASLLGPPVGQPSASYELFASRMDLHRGHAIGAIGHAEVAVDLTLQLENRELTDYALANLVNVLFQSGKLERAREVAETLRQRTDSAVLKPISGAMIALVDGSRDANLDEIRATLIDLASQHARSGLGYYAGITWLNIADLERARGELASTAEAARLAIEALSGISLGFEVETARIALIWALVLKGDWEAAVSEMNEAERLPHEAVQGEVLVELAEIHAWFGDMATAEALVERARSVPVLPEVFGDLIHLTNTELALRRADLTSAKEELASIDIDTPHPTFGFLARFKFMRASLAVQSGLPEAHREAASALHHAAAQGARPLAAASRVLLAIADEGVGLQQSVITAATEFPWTLSTLAECLAERLDLLQGPAAEKIGREVRCRPLRWRHPLRRAIAEGEPDLRLPAAILLDEIGESCDIAVLRRVARSLRGRQGAANLGRGLARRLAKPVVVSDQGRVHVRVGGEVIVGTDIRRKVLALLCFLLTRPQLAATRDQVLDALWPDLEPDIAGNSLNQTVYFLRRVFEPGFDDETSPGYVHHGSDVVWLDPELVTSDSIAARSAVRAAETDPTPENVRLVSDAYGGRFALDFSYEEWSVPYRDTLHASYLEIIEKAVSTDTNIGAYDRAIGLARRALEVDPEAEQIELSLLKLYRRTGAHAAAAEQYEHYAATLRNDLGLEPPPLESL